MLPFTSLPHNQKLIDFISTKMFYFTITYAVQFQIITKFYTNRRLNGDSISTTLRRMLNRNKVQKLVSFCKVIRDENIDSTKIASMYIYRSLQILHSDRNILQIELG